MTDKEMRMYDQMIEWGIATAEELNLARNLVNGSWEDVLNQVCFVRTGYATFEDYIDFEMGDEEEEDKEF